MSLNSTYNPMTVSLQENKGWEGSLGKGEEARILVFPRENHRWDLKLKTQEQKQNKQPPTPKPQTTKAGYLLHEGRPRNHQLKEEARSGLVAWRYNLSGVER